MNNISPNISEQSVNFHFKALAISWWIGYPLSLVDSFMPLLGLIWVPALTVTTIYWCILLYRHWTLLQDHGARVTPGKAVGFGFIPFYCFYWWFVAYAGLAEDNNRYFEKEDISHIRMSYGLAVTDCILSILACTIGLHPVLNILITIPLMVIGFTLVCQQRQCVLVMLKKNSNQKLEPTVKTPVE